MTNTANTMNPAEGRGNASAAVLEKNAAPEAAALSAQLSDGVVDLAPCVNVGGAIPVRVRTVAVAMVKNEADIIEAWTSHMVGLFDLILIADHCSTDGTFEYLEKLALENKKIVLYRYHNQSYRQENVTAILTKIAAAKCSNAWIFPVDADEFLGFASQSEFNALLDNTDAKTVIQFPWYTCVPQQMLQDCKVDLDEPVFVSPEPSVYRKSAVHVGSILRGACFAKGGHDVMNDGKEYLKQTVGRMYHFPLRSVSQFALKCVQGCLAYMAIPQNERPPMDGFHWFDMMQKAHKRGEISTGFVRSVAINYGQRLPASLPDTSLSKLIDQGWRTSKLKIAREKKWPLINRRQNFGDIANQLTQGRSEADLKAVAAMAQTAQLRAAQYAINEQSMWGADNLFLKLEARAESDFAAFQSPPAFLEAFLSRALTRPQTPVPSGSAWTEHLPFMYCLVDFLQPRRFVELGSHHGNSFFGACQSALRHKQTECVAIDCWEGDTHAGYYDEKIFNDFKNLLNLNYAEVGKYIRKYFDQANCQFADGSVDLLHIDGLHTYEAVKSDYELWRRTLTDRGIIMFHDIHVHERGFGVWKLWGELKAQFPSIEFEHCFGLGVLYVGSDPNSKAGRLVNILSQPEMTSFARNFFSSVGRTLH